MKISDMIAQNICKWMKAVMAAVVTLTALTGCHDYWHQDYQDCPYGVYVKFKYDYNLQRADMFPDHVGQVTLYVFDDKGNFVTSQTETNSALSSPLKDPNYVMHIENLQPGKYQFLALAGQNAYADQLKTNRAKFVRTEPTTGDNMQKLEVNLDKEQRTGYYAIENHNLPLDTLWHGKLFEGIEVSSSKPAYATIPLIRDTKKINITLRELSDPTTIDVNDFSFIIQDHNPRILYDNSLDETNLVVYTPHATWNTSDREGSTAGDADGNVVEGVGKIAHADFMTSRILYHDQAKDDGRLIITSKETGKIVVNVDLPDLLSRVRTSEEYMYAPQEFLDRAYDYKLQFYLQNGQLKYVFITISVNALSWSQRVQLEQLNN